MPIVDVEAGCASGAAALMLAASAVAAGQYDTVLAFGIEKMPKGIIRSSFFEPWQEAAGLGSTPAYFALRAQRLMATSGVTEDDLAAVVVKNRRHGVANPDAMFRSEVKSRGGAGLTHGLPTPASVDAVLTQRRSGGRRLAAGTGAEKATCGWPRRC